MVNHIRVGDCFPKIPSNARIVDPDTIYGTRTGHTWVRSGASFDGESEEIIYAEPGSTINSGGSASIIYVKAGAQLLRADEDFVLYEEGALSGGGSSVVKCPDLNFDYSEAPSPDDFASVSSEELSQFTIERIGDRIEVRTDAHIRDIQIYDLLGRLVHRQLESSAIDVRNWISGKYVIRVNFGSEAISKMIFVE
jgi:hypothetical protein